MSGIHATKGIAYFGQSKPNIPPPLAAKYHRLKATQEILREIKEANPDGDNLGLSKAEEIIQRIADVEEADYHHEADRFVVTLLMGNLVSDLFADIKY